MPIRPIFREPGRTPRDLYPEQAQRYVNVLRRFIGNDLLLARTADYNKSFQAKGGVNAARLREKQPLIEAFVEFDRRTWHGRKALSSLDTQLASLCNFAGLCAVVEPTLEGPVRENHRGRLIDLNGQIHPLVLEWNAAVPFLRMPRSGIFWNPPNLKAPEFVAHVEGEEFEVECKRQSPMVVELFGDTEADEFAQSLLDVLQERGLRGRIEITLPLASINAKEVLCDQEMRTALGEGQFNIEAKSGIRLECELVRKDGLRLPSNEWLEGMQKAKPGSARLYSHAEADGNYAIDPTEIYINGPRRTSEELIEYLWDRKFDKAGSQCSGQRGAIVVMEWDGVRDPTLFRESEGITALLEKTFLKHKHVAAIVHRCPAEWDLTTGSFGFNAKAYLSTSNVTLYPGIADLASVAMKRR